MHLVPFMCRYALFPKNVFYLYSFKLLRTDALRSLPLLSPFHPAPSPSSSLMVITQQQEEDAGWVICILYQTKSTPSPMSIVSSSPAHPQHSSKHEPGNQLPYPSSHGDLAAACKSDGGTDARVSLVFLDARSVSSGNI
jgi:hypothetical protein